MDAMKSLAIALEELPDGSALDLQPDRLWRASLLSKLDEESSDLLRTLRRVRETVESSLSNYKTISDDVQQSTTRLRELLNHLSGRIGRLRYITSFDRRGKTKLPILEYLPPLKNTLNESIASLNQKATLLETSETLITQINEWRWNVQTLWTPTKSLNKNVSLPELSASLVPPTSENILPVAENACPLEQLASSSHRVIAGDRSVDAFASWISEEDPVKLFEIVGVVQDVYLLRENTVGQRESAVISIGVEGLPTSWVRVIRGGHTHSEETISFSNSKESAFGPNVDAVVSDLASDSKIPNSKGISSNNAVTLSEFADYLRIIASTCPPYPLSEYSRRWYARHVVMALRRARHGPGHLPHDPLAELHTKNPDDDEKGVWNDAQSLIRLSETFNANFRHEYALELAERGLALIESTPNPRGTEYRRKPYSYALRAKYEALAGLNNPEDALQVIQSACQVLDLGNHDGPYEDGRQVEALDSYASTLSILDRLDEAIEVERDAIGRGRELCKLNEDEHLPRLASLLINLADLLAEVDELDEAVAVARESVDIYKKLYATRPDVYRKDLTTSLSTFASVLFRTSHADEAIAIGNESIQTCDEQFILQPDIYREDLAERHYQQALYTAENDDFDTACEHGRIAVDHRRWLFEHQPDVHRFGLAQFLTNWAGDLLSADRASEAVAAGREALTLFRDLQKTSPEMYRSDLRLGLDNLATYLEQVGDFEEAEGLRTETAAIPIEDFDSGDDDWEDDDEEDQHLHEHHHHHHHHHDGDHKH